MAQQWHAGDTEDERLIHWKTKLCGHLVLERTLAEGLVSLPLLAETHTCVCGQVLYSVSFNIYCIYSYTWKSEVCVKRQKEAGIVRRRMADESSTVPSALGVFCVARLLTCYSINDVKGVRVRGEKSHFHLNHKKTSRLLTLCQPRSTILFSE